MLAMITLLKDNGFSCILEKETISRNGRAHIYIQFPRPLSDAERIALQASMGSDRKRELLSLSRILGGTDRQPTTFFEVKV